MSAKAPNLIERIDDAQQRTIAAFVRQCKFGQQTKRLPDNLAACGQFIGGDAEAIPQLGLHGISAALRVLGPCSSDECRSIVQRIVAYCEQCFGLNTAVPLHVDVDVKPEDRRNVIKLGELLYGLSFVKTAQAEPQQLIRHVGNLLTTSLMEGKGWGYFLGDEHPELLPTAYAIRGLAQNGWDVKPARNFVLDTLNMGNHAESSPADLTTAAACTYCLTFCGEPPGSPDPILKETFLILWSVLEPLMEEDIEQNLEYWTHDLTQTFYVRIPWQLYLLALASEYSQWRFASFRAQHCLNRAIKAIRADKFRYPYSGTHLSSRTNGIAYEVLTMIRNRTRYLWQLRINNLVDSVRVFIGSRVVRRTAMVLAATGIVVICWEWYQTGNLSDLAPHFISAIFIFLLAWGRR